MRITKIKIIPVDRSPVRAYASVVFDKCFAVNRLKVIRETDGRFSVSMPSARVRNSLYIDIAAPLTAELRQSIEDAVLKEFARKTGELIKH